nr:hypothetical protein [Tanacetum cinerariifolium]
SSDGNVDPYYEARVSNTAGDVPERDLLLFVPGPYYLPYPYDEGTALDRFPTPAETHRLRELSSTIKKQSADPRQQNESTVYANEGVSRLTSGLGVLDRGLPALSAKAGKKKRKARNDQYNRCSKKLSRVVSP